MRKNKFKIMKKSVFVLFGIAVLVSCSKKNESSESNVMMEEPKVEVKDSASAAKPSDQAVVKTDSVAVKVDSTAKK